MPQSHDLRAQKSNIYLRQGAAIQNLPLLNSFLSLRSSHP